VYTNSIYIVVALIIMYIRI